MKSVKEQIVNDLIDARMNKNRIESSILSTLIGDIQNKEKSTKSKEVSNDDIIAIIKVFLKNIEITMEKVTDPNKSLELQHEKNLLSNYLPTILSNDEIESIIQTNELDNMAKAMKFFKLNYANRYNAKELSQRFK